MAIIWPYDNVYNKNGQQYTHVIQNIQFDSAETLCVENRHYGIMKHFC